MLPIHMAKTKKKIPSTKKIKAGSKRVSPRKSKDIPVTQEMLFEVQNRLIHELNSNRSEMNAKFEKLLSEVHRIGLLVEEQNARNKFVLDGYTSLSDRIDANSNEIRSINKTLESF